MRYLKIASAKNPNNDFIELNDFYGFLCTSFQTIGISRKLEFLPIKNRQFVVSNKTNFKKYNLVIEILSKFSQYDSFYDRLITFLDRNKKDGIRLYYSPYGKDNNLKYCLCDIEASSKPEKMKPVTLVLSQGSLWLGEEKINKTAQNIKELDNLFVFNENFVFDDNGEEVSYYSLGFYEDDSLKNYYCVNFFGGFFSEAKIVNNSYNEIPINVKIKGPCVNPSLFLYKVGSNEPIRQTKIYANIDTDYYVEISSNIIENGVWYVNSKTGKKIPYDELVDNEHSPYFFIEHGEYVLKVVDEGENVCETEINYQEEFSE